MFRVNSPQWNQWAGLSIEDAYWVKVHYSNMAHDTPLLSDTTLDKEPPINMDDIPVADWRLMAGEEKAAQEEETEEESANGY